MSLITRKRLLLAGFLQRPGISGRPGNVLEFSKTETFQVDRGIKQRFWVKGKADNMMLREESHKLVLIDFGLSTNTAFVPSNVNPVGSQTHWSPEKASSAGYDFSADLWAAICVFVHILAGTEPWLSRFGNAGLLHLVIYNYSPPVEDIPEGLPVEIQNLIESGWTVNPQDRPSVEQLLNHSAFSLLENASPDDDQFRQHWPVVTSASDGESPAVVDETGPVRQAEEEDDPDEYNLNDGEQLLAEFHLSLGHFRDGRGDTVGTREELEPARQFTGTRETEQQNLAETQDVGQEQDMEQVEEQAALQDELEHLHRVIEPDDGEHMNSPRSNDVFDVTGSCESAREDSIIVVDLNKLIMEPSEKGPALRVNPAVLGQLNARLERRRPAVSVNTDRVEDRTRSHDVTAAEDVAANAVEPYSVNSSRNVCQRGTEEREEHDSGNRIPLPVLPVFDEEVSDESGGDGDLSKTAAGQFDNGATPMMLEENPNQAHDASCPADRSYLGSLNSLMSSSLGTVVTVYYNENRVYSLNLLPGRQVLWADVMKRAASSKIEELELSEFTAVMADDSAINVNDYVPSEQSIQVIIQPVSDDYAWKIDASGEIYIPPGYRGPFRSRFNDD